MANILNTLNLIQVKGGVNIKQGDNTSILEYELGYTNTSNMMTDPMLDGKTANINLYNRLKNTKWSRQSTVKGNRVSFTIDEALELGVYMLDIEVDGHVFPSDGESRIRIHEGYESYMDGRSAAVAVATAKNIANEAIRLAVLENVDKIKGEKGDPGIVGPVGPKGEKGPKGDKSIVFSSTQPDDKEVIWVKNDNIRNVYRKYYPSSNGGAVIGKVSNYQNNIPDEYNLILEFNEQVNNIDEKFDYLRINGHEIQIIKKEYHIQYDYMLNCKISDEDLETIKENIIHFYLNFNAEGYAIFPLINQETCLEQMELVKKTGEETYSTISVYNFVTEKWERMVESDIKM